MLIVVLNLGAISSPGLSVDLRYGTSSEKTSTQFSVFPELVEKKLWIFH